MKEENEIVSSIVCTSRLKKELGNAFAAKKLKWYLHEVKLC